MNIYVIRHGKTPLNILKKVNGEIDEPLAPEGIAEAHEAIVTIPKSISHIYSSSLMRAKSTADIFAKSLVLPISYHTELSEIKMGTLAGKSWDEMENGQKLKKLHRSVQYNYREYGGENLSDVKTRLLELLKTIYSTHTDNSALLVTHGGIIRTLRFLETGEAIDETEKHVTPILVNLSRIVEKFG